MSHARRQTPGRATTHRRAGWPPPAWPRLDPWSAEDLIDGVTMEEKLEELTGLTRRVVIESKDKDTRPRLVIVGDDGEPLTLPKLYITGHSMGGASKFRPIASQLSI